MRIALAYQYLVSHASAQVASVCRGDACFKLNIPQNTASSGTGDIFFQISAPSSYEWVALGLGSRMAGSNIFVVYTSGDGNNVTLSPRSTSNYNQPNFNANVQATLLEGSGVSGGKMIANVRCKALIDPFVVSSSHFGRLELQQWKWRLRLQSHKRELDICVPILRRP